MVKNKRCRKKKVIPLHFKTKKSASVSELLNLASCRRRSKELLQKNRQLASALQDFQCQNAHKDTILQSYAKDATQIKLAQNKLKEMAVTIQTLVSDLDVSLNYLYGCNLTSLKQTGNLDLRLQICPPDLDTIDESIRSTPGRESEGLLNTPTLSPNFINSSKPTGVRNDLTSAFDASATEIYNVNSFYPNNFEKLKNCNANQPTKLSNEDMSLTEMIPLATISDVASSLQKESNATPKLPVSPVNINTKPLNKISVDALSTEIQTPPTPQFDLDFIPTRRDLLDSFLKQTPNFSVQNISSEKLRAQGSKNSKIPVKQKNILHDLDLPSLPETSAAAPRRETFVISQSKDKNDLMPSSDKQQTHSVQDKIEELQDKTVQNRRGTFVIPTLPKSITNLKSVPEPEKFKTILGDIQSNNQTKMFEEDMELTEIIPTDFVLRSLPKESDKQTVLAVAPLNAQNLHLLPPVLMMATPISPINKDNSKLKTLNDQDKLHVSDFNNKNCPDSNFDENLEFNPLHHSKAKCSSTPNNLKNQTIHQNVIANSESYNVDLDAPGKYSVDCKKKSRSSRKSVLPIQSHCSKETPKHLKMTNETDLLDNIDKETLVECLKDNKKSSNRISRKSMLKNPLKRPSEQNVLPSKKQFQEATGKVVATDDLIPCASQTLTNVLEENNLLQSSPTTSGTPSRTTKGNRKSVMFAVSETSSESSLSISGISDIDPDYVEEKKEPTIRIPNRRSIKPNRRGPFIFISKNKNRKTSPKADNVNTVSTESKTLFYNFSSSEDEDSETKKPKKSKKSTKKSTKLSKKNTVSVLERDIGLMYQEQGRRKRSLNRKVSFAVANVTPTNSECEGDKESSGISKIEEAVQITMNDFEKASMKDPQTTEASVKSTTEKKRKKDTSASNMVNPDPIIAANKKNQLSKNLSPAKIVEQANNINEPYNIKSPVKSTAKSVKTDDAIASNVVDNDILTVNKENLGSKQRSSANAKKKCESGFKTDILNAKTDSSLNSRRSKSTKFSENAKDLIVSTSSEPRKTTSTSNMNDVLIPDLESGGRSRRNRPKISLKEPSLNVKMRR